MSDAVIGTTAGNYRILEKISDGGMGTVYRAEHVMIGQRVAIKVLQPELTHNREIVARFFNEAKATSAIRHPGIVVVLDFGYLESGLAYIVMELLEGMTLARRIKMRGPMPEGEAAAMLRGVCSGLQAAHDKGIIHRDLKPDNLFLVEDPDVNGGERLKILDFGIAKLTDIGSAHAATKTGAVMGTPTYMSPEQCRGAGDVDVRADIYSLGCIFYQLLTGRPPFAMEGAGEVIGMHLYVQPEPPSRHQLGISPDTEALVMAMLAKEPNLRPQTARDLAQALATIASQHGWSTASAARWSHDGQGGYQPSLTPAYLSPQPTPAPTGTYPPTRPPTASPNQPTTLSGAASQSVAAPPKSRKGPLIAVAAALVIVGSGVAFSIANSNDDKLKPVTATVPAAPTPGPPPTPTQQVVAPPPVVEKPPEKPPEKPVEPLPVVEQVAKPIEKPIEKKPTIAKRPTEKKPTEKKPVEKKPKNPDNGDLPVETNVE